MNYFQVVGAAYEYEYGARLSRSDRASDQFFGYYLMSDAASSPGGNFLYYWPNSYGHSMARSTIGFNDQMMSSIGNAGKNLAHSGQKAIHSTGQGIENIAKSTPQAAKQSLGRVKNHADDLLPNANGMMKETRHLGNQAAHEFSSSASTVFHGVEHLGKQAQPALRSAHRVASNAAHVANGVNQAGKIASSAMSFFGQAGKALGSVASFTSEIAKNL